MGHPDPICCGCYGLVLATACNCDCHQKGALFTELSEMSKRTDEELLDMIREGDLSDLEERLRCPECSDLRAKAEALEWLLEKVLCYAPKDKLERMAPDDFECVKAFERGQDILPLIKKTRGQG